MAMGYRIGICVAMFGEQIKQLLVAGSIIGDARALAISVPFVSTRAAS